MSLTPARHSLTIWKDATFHEHLIVELDSTLWNLAEYTAVFPIFETLESKTPLLELTTQNKGIELGEGTIDLIISAKSTSELTWKSGVYQLLITSPAPASEVYPLMWGPIRVKGI